jgi:hypothetical protein
VYHFHHVCEKQFCLLIAATAAHHLVVDNFPELNVQAKAGRTYIYIYLHVMILLVNVG